MVVFAYALTGNDQLDEAIGFAKDYCKENGLTPETASIVKVYKKNTNNIDLVLVKLI